jgi:phage tail sheath protein FI
MEKAYNKEKKRVAYSYIGKSGLDAASSTGLNALGLIDEISILYSPDVQSMPGLAEAMIEQCEALKDRIVILEAALGDTDPEPLDNYDSKYAAYYAPWIRVSDTAGQSRLVPPGGFIAGTYSKTDHTRGVHKSPANIPLVGITGVEIAISGSEQDNLAMSNVNPILPRYGSDIVAYGGKTLTNDPEYRYICLTRYAAYVKESLMESLELLVFEDWNPLSLGKAKMACHDFLNSEWQKGALMGNKATEAFFVQITPYGESSLDIMAGLALLKPAEFFITGFTLDRQ